MARVNLDGKFFSDARFIHLGHLLGSDKFGARGRILGVWHYCYEHVKDILTAQEIDTQAEWFGTNGNSFAEILVTADLAERVKDKYRIKGALERFKYILQCREAAARGGKRSATVRQASAQPDAQANGSPDAQANGQATLKHALALVPTLAPVTPQETEKTSPLPGPKPSDVLRKWNELAARVGLPKCLKLSDERVRHLETRLSEPSFRDGLDRLFELIADSPFLTGDNDRQWTATFDWLIKNDGNYLKVLEGKYTKSEAGDGGGDGWDIPPPEPLRPTSVEGANG